MLLLKTMFALSKPCSKQIHIPWKLLQSIGCSEDRVRVHKHIKTASIVL